MRQQKGRANLLCAAMAAAFLVATIPAGAPAGEVGSVTKRPLPRYVSLGSNKINVRRGPGLDYRKDWVFHRAGMPVKIVGEYGNWRRVVDKDQAGGWIYQAMLSRRRTVLITEDGTLLRAAPDPAAPASAKAEQGVVAAIDSCGPDWCRIETGGYEGWVPKTAVWGVDPDEIIKD